MCMGEEGSGDDVLPSLPTHKAFMHGFFRVLVSKEQCPTHSHGGGAGDWRGGAPRLGRDGSRTGPLSILNPISSAVILLTHHCPEGDSESVGWNNRVAGTELETVTIPATREQLNEPQSRYNIIYIMYSRRLC